MVLELLDNYIINPYLRGLLVLFITFVVLEFFVFVIQKIVGVFTRRTKTNLDDLIAERSYKPITAIIIVVGLRFAINELPISADLEVIISRIMFSIVIVLIGYIIYFVVDLLSSYGWHRFSSKTKSKIDEALINLVHSILMIAWIVIVALYLLDFWGVQIGPLLAGLGIAGLAVALALQPTLSNIFSGISIVMDKTIRVGDLIYLDAETKGKIMKVGLRSTRIITFDNELIIVPNSKLADSRIQNVALPEPKSRVVIEFGVAYGSDIEKVKKIVLKEISTITHLVDSPQPTVRFRAMGNSSLDFKAYFYVDSFEHRFIAIDEANTKIYNALNKNKISIPFPQMDVHLFKEK